MPLPLLVLDEDATGLRLGRDLIWTGSEAPAVGWTSRDTHTSGATHAARDRGAVGYSVI